LPSDWCGAYRSQEAPEPVMQAVTVPVTTVTKTYEPVPVETQPAAEPVGAFWSRKKWKERLGI
jgi:hypothetical protein